MSQGSIPFRWIEPCLSCAQARGVLNGLFPGRRLCSTQSLVELW